MSGPSEPAEPVLVVDLGTTSSSAVLVSRVEATLLPEPVSGSDSWPSAVYWDGRQMLVGTPAAHRRRSDPTGGGVGFKQSLGSETPVQLGSRAFRPVEQAAAMLTALRREAEHRHGGPVWRALVTVPASYGPDDIRREWMIAAAEAAGFATVELLPEPVAAAHAPDSGPGLTAGDLVLVYDLGGGTFDTALVRMGTRVPEILGHAAVDDCGGRDIDALLGRRIAEFGRDWLEPLVPAGADESATLRLSIAVAEFAQRVKHQLSDAVTVEDHLLPSAPAFRIDRATLAGLATPVLARTVTCCRELLDRLGVPLDHVTTILLVGGGSRMPAVVETLFHELGRPLRRVEEPELATVRGAARWLLRSGPRLVPALSSDDRRVPLAFAVPGGAARLVRWLVEPGEAYVVGQPLGRIRLPDGAGWDLVASAPGRVERFLAAPGADVAAGQWLALARGGRQPAPDVTT